jgi:thiamine-phosphate pyrophosphorylase
MSTGDGNQRHRIGGLHVLTDTSIQHRFGHAELATLAARGGANVVQLRAKSASTRQLLDWGREAKEACREHGCLFLINDRVDVALALPADGVHLGQDDMPVGTARRLLGPGAVIGSSVHNLAELRQAAEEGASYVAFGPMYRTRTKLDTDKVKELHELSALCEASLLPVIAIGGIGPDQVPELLTAGAAGVAAVSAVCLDPEPLQATRAFVRALGERGGPPQDLRLSRHR